MCRKLGTPEKGNTGLISTLSDDLNTKCSMSTGLKIDRPCLTARNYKETLWVQFSSWCHEIFCLKVEIFELLKIKRFVDVKEKSKQKTA